MSAVLSSAVPAPSLPKLFDAGARTARFSTLAPCDAVRLASEILLRALNTIAIDPASRIPDRRVTETGASRWP